MLIEMETVKQTTELCRYCLMCRHVCPVTHVTRSEATSPHGWGILVASVERGITTWTEDNVNTLYQCADCGLCRSHCSTDQPLPLAINAARAELVEKNFSPQAVYNLQTKLIQWQNPYVEASPTSISSSESPAVLIVGAVGHHLQPETVSAATKLLAAVGVEVTPIAIGREGAYLPNTLGLVDEACKLAQDTLAEIEQTGAKQVFVLSPEEIYTYETLLSYLGLEWPEGVELIEVTAFLADKVQAGTLNFKPASLADYTYFDPDHTVRISERWDAPRQLLGAMTDTPLIELFWRKERAAPCGASGGLPVTQPELAGQLAHSRLTEALERGAKTIITDDPRSLVHLREYALEANLDIAVEGLYELLVAHLAP